MVDRDYAEFNGEQTPPPAKMMKELLSTCLLLALLSPALPLKCRYGFNKTALTFAGNVRADCTFRQDVCVASVLRTNICKIYLQLSNQCSPSRMCLSGDYSFTAADGKFFEMKMQCCKTDWCNNAFLSLPDRNMLAENGLQCPSCFSKGTIMCKSEKTINCLENETQCIQFKVDLSTDFFQIYSFTFQGCGTTDFCAIRKNKKKAFGAGNFVLYVTQEGCNNASRISHQPEHEE
ncbi:phospholipase A2 inhibitor and Ly6/PLAUR domain-containing protein-like [Podarcis muralis]